MKFANATKPDRKFGVVEGRDLQCPARFASAYLGRKRWAKPLRTMSLDE
jgi:hypothetical protein